MAEDEPTWSTRGLGPNHARDMALVMAVEELSLEGARRALDDGLLVACGRVTSSLAIAFHLLERGADPNLPNERSGETALTAAIRGRHLELVKRLLDAGADPNRPNAKGKRALDISMDTLTFNRRVPVDQGIVELLRERGAT